MQISKPFKFSLPKEIPLAWSQLSHQKVRLLVAISGISFANILIFMQLGFRATMFDGVTRFPENVQGDLFLVNRNSKFLGNQSFPKDQLYRVSAIDAIEAAKPLYYTQTSWVNPWNKEVTDVTVIAFNPAQPVMNLPAINQQLVQIEQPDTVLFDRKSLSSLGSVGQAFEQGETVSTEVGDRQIWVGGLFSMGSSLFKRGHVVTSDLNYLRLFGEAGADNIHAGVLTLEPDANPVEVIAQLQTILPEDVAILNHQELIALENRYWSNQPPGIIFNFGTIMGFVVGVIIVYQVLYTDVNEHLPEYATLKAIGYSDNQLLVVVFQEAIILAVLGFLPGFGCSIALYGVLGNLTQLAVVMRFDVALQVFILTVLMCMISAAITVRKLRSADPADVF
ncbi:ABC transporter permease DevC [Leptolyngbya sp. FACHB-711]|uniref:ABC transporter permease DevC n=1 Tax=unclassified Leptolyngbya TaxID=2650499 RepID=UPI001684F47E|nr:ABC transporter permease DevC [Leptolyngbya sp. FACHB-711]MBD1851472.1 FtsX-like permease family protein [Cyanobacteria bacterium FACHB-502]MBD2023717.1 FtsX-like permease family protein [Leptolyngbya sp. FACHB-711]